MSNISLSPSFINDTGTVSVIIKGLYDNVGGSWFVTIMLIMLFIFLIAFILRLPFELTAIFMLPLFIACYVYVPDFLAVTGLLLIYLGILIGKNYFIR